jgi:hypothetical protein
VKIFNTADFIPFILYCTFTSVKSRDSSVGVAAGYGFDNWMIGNPFPLVDEYFSFHHRV